MNWHACGKEFEQMVLNLKWRLDVYQEKKNVLDIINYTVTWPIILLRLGDWLGKKGHRFEVSVGKMAVKTLIAEKRRNFLGCCCTFDNFS